MSYTDYFELMCDKEFFLDIINAMDEFFADYSLSQRKKRLKAKENG